MIKRLIAVLMLLALSEPAMGQTLREKAQALREKAQTLREKASGYVDAKNADIHARIRREIKLPVGTKTISNVAYGSDPAQAMDVYLPAKANNAPVIFMVHGGGWARGDKAASGVVSNKASRWIPKGVAIISTNYRMVPKADPYVQAEDVGKAIAFAQGKAKDWNIDADRFVLMGHSAGAHLVSLINADPNIAISQGAKPWLGTVSLDSAAYDVNKVMSEAHPSLYDNAFGKDPELWKKASPLLKVSDKIKPMLLVCAKYRRTSPAQSEEFSKKIVSLGGSAEVLPVPLNHGQINQNLGLPGEYTEKVESFLHSLGII